MPAHFEQIIYGELPNVSSGSKAAIQRIWLGCPLLGVKRTLFGWGWKVRF